MKSLITKATVTSREGFYYREEHEWRNLAPQAATWFGAKLKEMTDFAVKADKKHEPGDRQCLLECSVDGVAQNPIMVSVSKQEQKKFQRLAARMGDDLLAID